MQKDEMLKNVLDYDITPVINRYCRVYNIDKETATLHEIELKKYLFLCSIRNKKGYSYGIRGQIDELWHTFIIFTNLYNDFCIKKLGKFIHHSPTEEKTSTPYESEEKYWRTIDAYSEYFMTEPPYNIWIRPQSLKDISMIHGENSSSSSSGPSASTDNDTVDDSSDNGDSSDTDYD